MTRWLAAELPMLAGVLERIEEGLRPLPGKEILVLCCGTGEVALWLGEKIAGRGSVVGLDLSDELLAQARERAREKGLEGIVRFQKVEMYRLPFPDESFDALVSEFILYPAPLITQIGQPEMARVLRFGGKMLLTDVIVTRPLAEGTAAALKAISLDYLCEATKDDFRGWMAEAGLRRIEVLDLTPTVKEVWQQRRASDPTPEHRAGYKILLDDPELRLGQAVFYIYVRGEK